MREWKRIFLNVFWLPAVFLLLLANQLLYIQIQRETLPVDRKEYLEASNSLDELLLKLPPRERQQKLDNIVEETENRAFISYLVEIYESDKELYDSTIEMQGDQAEDVRKLVETERNSATKDSVKRDKAMQLVTSDRKASETYVNQYESKLNYLNKQAENMKNMPIFRNDASFEYQNILKTVEDFETMRGKRLTPGNDRLFLSIFDDDIGSICGIILLMITVILIFDERKSGLEILIHTMPKGRGNLMGLRFVSIAIAASVSMILFYIGRIFLASWYYQGLPEWGRLLQSVQRFEDFPIPMTILQFLILYGCLQFLGFLFMGLFLWAMLSFFRNLNMGIMIAAVFFAIEYYSFVYFKSNELLGFMRSFNMFACLSMRSIFYRYLNYRIMGHLFSEFTIVLVLMLVSIILLGILCMVRGSFGHANAGRQRVYNFPWKFKKSHKQKCPSSISLKEHKKVWIFSKGLPVCLLFVLFVFTQIKLPIVQLSGVQRCQQDYLAELEGPLTENHYRKLIHKKKEVRKKYEALILEQREFGFFMDPEIEKTLNQTIAMDNIVKRANQLKKNGDKNIWILREHVYQELFGKDSELWRIKSFSMAVIILVLILVPVFGYENQCRMRQYLRLQPEGRKLLFHKKIKLAIMVTVGVWLILSFKEWQLVMHMWGGFPAVSANITSLMSWESHLPSLPIAAYLCLLYVSRLFVLLTAALVILLISLFSDTIMKGMCMGIMAFMVPAVLGFIPALKFFETLSLVTQAGKVELNPSILQLMILTISCVLLDLMIQMRWRRYES
ncbi:MAG: hypothetical protein RR223_06380 [Lachnospiraceae bacterium]